jgi:glutamate/tyrosine decarboxylase-like PLP-dependent enzyme
MKLPERGTSQAEILQRMRERKAADADWEGGRTWSLVYPASKQVDDMLAAANELYQFENALNPFRFPSLRSMEEEVCAMTAGLLHAPEGAGGAMTSGGTESILMAVKAARDRARAEKGILAPQLLAPYTAHPAFAKACSYLGLEHVQIPVGADKRADVSAAAELVCSETVLIVGSAPNYPFGVVDPIPELAALAAEREINFHTDACLGGFLLPFFEELGEAIPPFDFRVPGVATISADVHKYGYCTKGASIITHRSKAHLHQYQLFVYDQWPGGIYGSFAMAGARPAAPIAAAWAIMNFLGREGYTELARTIRDTTRKLREGIEAIPELTIWADPVMSVMSFGSTSIDITAVADVMDKRGWHLDRQNDPDALHLMVSPAHARVADRFLADLREAVADHGTSEGVQARYS